MKRRGFISFGAAQDAPPACSLAALAHADDDTIAITRPRLFDGVQIGLDDTGTVVATFEGSLEGSGPRTIALFAQDDLNAVFAFNRVDGRNTVLDIARAHAVSGDGDIAASLHFVSALVRALYRGGVCAPVDRGADR